MGGMTTITLTDRRIDQQHSRARQDGCHTASSVGKMWDCFVVGGFFLNMWALERFDVAEICIVVFVWARFLL